jgi:hypothetical protein
MQIVKKMFVLLPLAENLIQQQSGQFSQLSFSLQVTTKRHGSNDSNYGVYKLVNMDCWLDKSYFVLLWMVLF